ncbi:MAG: ABC transporter permease [Candidatus Moeniiplasma glomeromycotorum]|nr:ABC transporter permease [Candidatus Moeniiplasma glomeromycotorum]
MFNYWKRSPGWMFGFIFPIFYLLLFRLFIPLQSYLPLLLISTTLGSGIFGLGITYADIKNSVIIKKIRVLPIPKWKVVSGIISFNFFITCLTNLWIFLFATLFFRSELNFTHINWFYLVVGFFLATLMASIIGFLIGSLASNIQDAGNFAFFITMPASFFSGQYIPIKAISRELGTVAKIIPFSYLNDIMKRAFSHYNLSAIKDNLLFANYWQPIIFSLLWIIGLFWLVLIIYKFQKE